MPRPRLVTAVATLALVCGAGCGGSGKSAASPAASSPTAALPQPTTTTSLAPSPIEGVQTFAVQAAHQTGPISYPQVPPVGGAHNPVWVPCGVYDTAVQNEMAVHSLEHGAVWFTYRADLPPADVSALATLAKSRKDILVSPWDDSLPAPLVATAWGRQLRLQSASDPRIVQFVTLYASQGPERGVPC